MVRLHAFRHAIGIEGATLGHLSSFNLAEITQVLNLGGKTARLHLRAAGERGAVWFVSGTPVHAECGRSLTGAPAFYRMFGWTRGEFVIEHGATTEKRSLEGDSMYHVLEGLRRVDEQGDGSPTVPLPPVPGRGDSSSQRLPFLLGALLMCLAGAAWWLWGIRPDPVPDDALADAQVARPLSVPTPASPPPAKRARNSGKTSRRIPAGPRSAAAEKAAGGVAATKEPEPVPPAPEPLAQPPARVETVGARSSPSALDHAGGAAALEPSGGPAIEVEGTSAHGATSGPIGANPGDSPAGVESKDAPGGAPGPAD